MGRTQMETQLPYPPPPPHLQQNQAQMFSYPPPPQPPHQLHNPNSQQVGNGAPLSPFPQQNNSIADPSQVTFINNAGTGIPLQAGYASMVSPQIVAANKGTTAWTTGLFDCMEDPTNALTTALFPCVTFGQIADVLENGHTTCATSAIIYAFSYCLLSSGYRRKLRRMYGLVEAPASDRLTHSLFEWCALCQEYRELNNRGLNPALGQVAEAFMEYFEHQKNVKLKEGWT